jgi:hypothetical protein
MRGEIHPITGLLIGASLVTGLIFLVIAGVVFVCWLQASPSHPGDPNIGAGIVVLAGMLNLPVIVGWSIWAAFRGRTRRSLSAKSP